MKFLKRNLTTSTCGHGFFERPLYGLLLVFKNFLWKLSYVKDDPTFILYLLLPSALTYFVNRSWLRFQNDDYFVCLQNDGTFFDIFPPYNVIILCFENVGFDKNNFLIYFRTEIIRTSPRLSRRIYVVLVSDARFLSERNVWNVRYYFRDNATARILHNYPIIYDVESLNHLDANDLWK